MNNKKKLIALGILGLVVVVAAGSLIGYFVNKGKTTAKNTNTSQENQIPDAKQPDSQPTKPISEPEKPKPEDPGMKDAGKNENVDSENKPVIVDDNLNTNQWTNVLSSGLVFYNENQKPTAALQLKNLDLFVGKNATIKYGKILPASQAANPTDENVTLPKISQTPSEEPNLINTYNFVVKANDQKVIIPNLDPSSTYNFQLVVDNKYFQLNPIALSTSISQNPSLNIDEKDVTSHSVKILAQNIDPRFYADNKTTLYLTYREKGQEFWSTDAKEIKASIVDLDNFNSVNTKNGTFSALFNTLKPNTTYQFALNFAGNGLYQRVSRIYELTTKSAKEATTNKVSSVVVQNPTPTSVELVVTGIPSSVTKIRAQVGYHITNYPNKDYKIATSRILRDNDPTASQLQINYPSLKLFDYESFVSTDTSNGNKSKYPSAFNLAYGDADVKNGVATVKITGLKPGFDYKAIILDNSTGSVTTKDPDDPNYKATKIYQDFLNLSEVVNTKILTLNDESNSTITFTTGKKPEIYSTFDSTGSGILGIKNANSFGINTSIFFRYRDTIDAKNYVYIPAPTQGTSAYVYLQNLDGVYDYDFLSSSDSKDVLDPLKNYQIIYSGKISVKPTKIAVSDYSVEDIRSQEATLSFKNLDKYNGQQLSAILSEVKTKQKVTSLHVKVHTGELSFKFDNLKPDTSYEMQVFDSKNQTVGAARFKTKVDFSPIFQYQDGTKIRMLIANSKGENGVYYRNQFQVEYRHIDLGDATYIHRPWQTALITSKEQSDNDFYDIAKLRKLVSDRENDPKNLTTNPVSAYKFDNDVTVEGKIHPLTGYDYRILQNDNGKWQQISSGTWHVPYLKVNSAKNDASGLNLNFTYNKPTNQKFVFNYWILGSRVKTLKSFDLPLENIKNDDPRTTTDFQVNLKWGQDLELGKEYRWNVEVVETKNVNSPVYEYSLKHPVVIAGIRLADDFKNGTTGNDSFQVLNGLYAEYGFKQNSGDYQIASASDTNLKVRNNAYKKKEIKYLNFDVSQGKVDKKTTASYKNLPAEGKTNLIVFNPYLKNNLAAVDLSFNASEYTKNLYLVWKQQDSEKNFKLVGFKKLFNASDASANSLSAEKKLSLDAKNAFSTTLDKLALNATYQIAIVSAESEPTNESPALKVGEKTLSAEIQTNLTLVKPGAKVVTDIVTHKNLVDVTLTNLNLIPEKQYFLVLRQRKNLTDYVEYNTTDWQLFRNNLNWVSNSNKTNPVKTALKAFAFKVDKSGTTINGTTISNSVTNSNDNNSHFIVNSTSGSYPKIEGNSQTLKFHLDLAKDLKTESTLTDFYDFAIISGVDNSSLEKDLKNPDVVYQNTALEVLSQQNSLHIISQKVNSSQIELKYHLPLANELTDFTLRYFMFDKTQNSFHKQSKDNVFSTDYLRRSIDFWIDFPSDELETKFDPKTREVTYILKNLSPESRYQLALYNNKTFANGLSFADLTTLKGRVETNFSSALLNINNITNPAFYTRNGKKPEVVFVYSEDENFTSASQIAIKPIEDIYTNQTIALYNLKANTKYYYRVQLKNEASQTTPVQSFVTMKAPEFSFEQVDASSAYLVIDNLNSLGARFIGNGTLTAGSTPRKVPQTTNIRIEYIEVNKNQIQSSEAKSKITGQWTATDKKPKILLKKVNLGNSSQKILLENLDPTKSYIFKVFAVNPLADLPITKGKNGTLSTLNLDYVANYQANQIEIDPKTKQIASFLDSSTQARDTQKTTQAKNFFDSESENSDFYSKLSSLINSFSYASVLTNSDQTNTSREASFTNALTDDSLILISGNKAQKAVKNAFELYQILDLMVNSDGSYSDKSNADKTNTLVYNYQTKPVELGINSNSVTFKILDIYALYENLTSGLASYSSGTTGSKKDIYNGELDKESSLNDKLKDFKNKSVIIELTSPENSLQQKVVDYTMLANTTSNSFSQDPFNQNFFFDRNQKNKQLLFVKQLFNLKPDTDYQYKIYVATLNSENPYTKQTDISADTGQATSLNSQYSSENLKKLAGEILLVNQGDFHTKPSLEVSPILQTDNEAIIRVKNANYYDEQSILNVQDINATNAGKTKVGKNLVVIYGEDTEENRKYLKQIAAASHFESLQVGMNLPRPFYALPWFVNNYHSKLAVWKNPGKASLKIKIEAIDASDNIQDITLPVEKNKKYIFNVAYASYDLLMNFLGTYWLGDLSYSGTNPVNEILSSTYNGVGDLTFSDFISFDKTAKVKAGTDSLAGTESASYTASEDYPSQRYLGWLRDYVINWNYKNNTEISTNTTVQGEINTKIGTATEYYNPKMRFNKAINDGARLVRDTGENPWFSLTDTLIAQNLYKISTETTTTTSAVTLQSATETQAGFSNINKNIDPTLTDWQDLGSIAELGLFDNFAGGSTDKTKLSELGVQIPTSDTNPGLPKSATAVNTLYDNISRNSSGGYWSDKSIYRNLSGFDVNSTTNKLDNWASVVINSLSSIFISSSDPNLASGWYQVPPVKSLVKDLNYRLIDAINDGIGSKAGQNAPDTAASDNSATKTDPSQLNPYTQPGSDKVLIYRFTVNPIKTVNSDQDYLNSATAYLVELRFRIWFGNIQVKLVQIKQVKQQEAGSNLNLPWRQLAWYNTLINVNSNYSPSRGVDGSRKIDVSGISLKTIPGAPQKPNNFEYTYELKPSAVALNVEKQVTSLNSDPLIAPYNFGFQNLTNLQKTIENKNLNPFMGAFIINPDESQRSLFYSNVSKEKMLASIYQILKNSSFKFSGALIEKPQLKIAASDESQIKILAYNRNDLTSSAINWNGFNYRILLKQKNSIIGFSITIKPLIVDQKFGYQLSINDLPIVMNLNSETSSELKSITWQTLVNNGYYVASSLIDNENNNYYGANLDAIYFVSNSLDLKAKMEANKVSVPTSAVKTYSDVHWKLIDDGGANSIIAFENKTLNNQNNNFFTKDVVRWVGSSSNKPSSSVAVVTFTNLDPQKEYYISYTSASPGESEFLPYLNLSDLKGASLKTENGRGIRKITVKQDGSAKITVSGLPLNSIFKYQLLDSADAFFGILEKEMLTYVYYLDSKNSSLQSFYNKEFYSTGYEPNLTANYKDSGLNGDNKGFYALPNELIELKDTSSKISLDFSVLLQQRFAQLKTNQELAEFVKTYIKSFNGTGAFFNWQSFANGVSEKKYPRNGWLNFSDYFVYGSGLNQDEVQDKLKVSFVENGSTEFANVKGQLELASYFFIQNKITTSSTVSTMNATTGVYRNQKNTGNDNKIEGIYFGFYKKKGDGKNIYVSFGPNSFLEKNASVSDNIRVRNPITRCDTNFYIKKVLNTDNQVEVTKNFDDLKSQNRNVIGILNFSFNEEFAKEENSSS